MTAAEAVIGTLLVEGRMVGDVISVLPEEAIEDRGLQMIYRQICTLYKKGIGVDVLTVAKGLGADLNMVGGAARLMDIMNMINHTTNFNSHLNILIGEHVRSKLISIANVILVEAMDENKNVHETIVAANSLLDTITATNSTSTVHLSTEVQNSVEQVGEAKKHRELTGLNFSGMDTGIISLNKRLGGWESGSLTVIAARPAMGKTAIMLHCAAATRLPVLILSLEMPKHQLAKRYLSSVSGIEYMKLRSGEVTDNEFSNLMEKADTLMEYNIFIDDTPALNVDQIVPIANAIKRKYGLSAIFVDYLQLLRADEKNRNREQEVGYISRTLKAVSKRLELPVIALAQLSRANESRSDKRPQLSDLRDSGQIEQDADNIVFLHRPEYYDEFTDKDGNSTIGVMELITRKNRNGEIGTDKIQCDLSTNNFGEIQQQMKISSKQKEDANFDIF